MNLTNAIRRPSRDYNSIVYSIEETHVIDDLTELDAIETPDQIIEYLLVKLKSLDSKFNFTIRNLNSIDNQNQTIKQFYYFLIWNDLSRPNVCRLLNDDGYFASIELLKKPKNWSKYDFDKHSNRIDGKQYLNGMSLRDELLDSLIAILNMDFQLYSNKNVLFKEIEFDKTTIRLVFSVNVKTMDCLFQNDSDFHNETTNTVTTNGISGSTLSLANSSLIDSKLRSTGSIVSIPESITSTATDTLLSSSVKQKQSTNKRTKYVTYILNLTQIVSFSYSELKAQPLVIKKFQQKLEHYEFFRRYFEDNYGASQDGSTQASDEMRIYMLSYNSFKWSYDVYYAQHLLFNDYLMKQTKTPFAQAYKKLVLIRKSWKSKYFLKFLKIIENLKLNERRVSTSMGSRRRSSSIVSTTSSISSSIMATSTIAQQFEESIERTFTEYMLRVLFLKECCKNKNLPLNGTKEEFNAAIITPVLHDLLAMYETRYCECLLFNSKNIVPSFYVNLDSQPCYIGIQKLFNEVLLDWRRGRFGH